MAALESLMVELYIHTVDQWGDRAELDRIQTEAVRLAAGTCPNLCYVKMEMCHGEKPTWQRDLNKPMYPAIVGFSRSWAIVRKTVHRSGLPKAVLLDAKEDEVHCPESLC
ncbi:hypothetical protein VMCG_10365 [Cytospora schulzeri]|uniref:Uncharacterized protein n=1 Tax=Cytospora schulzeri TaxID=448051 RepID=A0A423VC51_9PEZI|nr:hypothetical protein VMCG_10365 [Valsa malicola]